MSPMVKKEIPKCSSDQSWCGTVITEVFKSDFSIGGIAKSVVVGGTKALVKLGVLKIQMMGIDAFEKIFGSKTKDQKIQKLCNEVAKLADISPDKLFFRVKCLENREKKNRKRKAREEQVLGGVKRARLDKTGSDSGHGTEDKKPCLKKLGLISPPIYKVTVFQGFQIRERLLLEGFTISRNTVMLPMKAAVLPMTKIRKLVI